MSSDELRLHSWDEKVYKYKIVESTILANHAKDLDEDVFVVRVRIVNSPLRGAQDINIKCPESIPSFGILVE